MYKIPFNSINPQVVIVIIIKLANYAHQHKHAALQN